MDVFIDRTIQTKMGTYKVHVWAIDFNGRKPGSFLPGYYRIWYRAPGEKFYTVQFGDLTPGPTGQYPERFEGSWMGNYPYDKDETELVNEVMEKMLKAINYKIRLKLERESPNLATVVSFEGLARAFFLWSLWRALLSRVF